MCYISTKFHKICTPALQHCAATTLQQQKFKLVLWSVLTVQSETAVILCFCRIFLVCRISECWNSTTSDVDSEHVHLSSVQCPDSDVVTCWQLQWTVSGSVSVTMFMMSYDVWCLHSLTDPRSSFISASLYSGLFPCEIWWVHICISYQYFFVSQCLTFPIHL